MRFATKIGLSATRASLPERSATRPAEGGTSPNRPGSGGKWMAWIALSASLLITFFAWYLIRDLTMKRAHDRFVFQTQTIESALGERLRAYEFLLQSGAGLFAASERVTRAQWRTFVAKLQIEKYYQGVQGLGFAKRILASEKMAHIRRIRKEGFPNYDIHPDGERPEYTSIIFLEPFNWRNQRAFGYDMFSEPTRKKAMVRARDTGLAAMSGKVTLLQETDKDVQAGFLMYLPVYRNGEVPETLKQRRGALTGYVYSPFRMQDFMRGIQLGQQEVELHIFDGDKPLKEALLYDSGERESLLSSSGHPHFFTRQSILEYAGRPWLLVFTSPSYLGGIIDTGPVNFILLLGIIISLLLFATVLTLTRSRNQALSLAGMSVSLERTNLELREKVVESEQAAEALQESELKFRTLVESTNDLIWEVDPNARYTYASPGVEALLGYKPAEMLGKMPVDFMEPEEGQRIAQIFGKLLEKHASFVAQENRNLHRDGRVVVLETSGVPFFDPKGELAGYRGIARDITARKQAVQALEESELRLRTILDTVVDGILVVDVQSKSFIMGNTAICRMLGYSIEEVYGLGIEDIHPAAVLTEVQERVERQEKGEIVLASDVPVQRKDGSVFFADVSSAPMFMAGRALRVGVFHDITERKQVAEKIRTMNEELEEKVRKRTRQLLEAQEELVRKEKLAVLGQVAGSVGHELRNPLGVMSNAVFYLQNVLVESDESVKEYLGIILAEISRSERIVAGLLDAVRTRSPEIATHNVTELIGQILRQCTVPDSVTVTLDIPETISPMRVDARQMQQVLGNLISNGVEAMPEGGTLVIRALENRQEKTITIMVQDSGHGMTPEVLAQLFQPLYTTKARGIGLGLLVAKNLVQANDGSVEVESENGKGSRFFVTLPGGEGIVTPHAIVDKEEEIS